MCNRPAFGLVVLVLACIVQAGEGPAHQSEAPKPRCAVLAQQGDATCAALADLLAVRLSGAGYATVDRANLAKTLDEHVLGQAFAQGATAARRQAGQIAGADLLVLLTSREKDKNRVIEWTVAAMPEGLRFAAGGALWNEQDPEPMLASMVASVERAAALRAAPVLQPVCVPLFVCRDPTFEFSGMQQALAKLTEEFLMQRPGVLVVALDEADALTTEYKLTGKTVEHKAPLFVNGSFTTKRTDDGLRISLDVELRTATATLGQHHLPDLDEDTLALSLRKTLNDLLTTFGVASPSATPDAEVHALRQHALGLARIGEWKDALPLLKTAALLRPDDLATRDDLVGTWSALVSSTAKVDRPDPARRLELMEHALDALEDVLHRRTPGWEDVMAVAFCRVHAELRVSPRHHPDEMARYHAIARRFRKLYARTLLGEFGQPEVRTRDLACRLLAQRFAIDRTADEDVFFADLVALVRELDTSPGNEKYVFELLTAPLRRYTIDLKAFRRLLDDCGAESSHLAALASLLKVLASADLDVAEQKFDASLPTVAAELSLAPATTDFMHEIAHTAIELGRARLARQRDKAFPSAPRLLPIDGLPRDAVRNWINADEGVEFIITYSAVYRLTPEGAFERVLDGDYEQSRWDSNALWLANSDKVVVLDSTGTVVAEQPVERAKYLTPAGPGRVFISLEDMNEQGGERVTYEMWSLRRNPSPALQREVLHVNNVNWVHNLPAGSALDRYMPRKECGFYVAASDADAALLFFNTYQPTRFDLKSRLFDLADRSWPCGTNCFELDGTYYFFGSYQADGRRSRAILSTAGLRQAPHLILDLGWVCDSRTGSRYDGHVSSAVTWGDWIHVLAGYAEAPPFWLAVNRTTKDVRVICVDPPAYYMLRSRLVVSDRFGLILIGAKAEQVELPPEETWAPYDAAVAHLRISAGEGSFDPWTRWRGSSVPSCPK